MENINKKDFARIYELMSFDRGKTLYEMEQKWDNLLTEAQVPAGSYVRKEIENSAKSENINKTWVEIKKEFGSNGSTNDNLMLYNAWVDGKWRPGVAVPEKYQTQTYKSKPAASTTTTTTVAGQVVTTTTTSATPQSVKLKYDANALLYYAMERRKKSIEPGGDLGNTEKYGNLALYFQDVRDNKAQDVTKYKITQADVDTFISEFEKMIAGDNAKLQQYADNGKGTTVSSTASGLDFKTQTSGNVAVNEPKDKSVLAGDEQSGKQGQEDLAKYDRIAPPLDKNDASAAFDQAFK